MNPNAPAFKPIPAQTPTNKENEQQGTRNVRGTLLRGNNSPPIHAATTEEDSPQSRIAASVARGQSSLPRYPLSTLYEEQIPTPQGSMVANHGASAFRRPPPLPPTQYGTMATPARSSSPTSPHGGKRNYQTVLHSHPFANNQAPSPGLPFILQTPIKVQVGVALPTPKPTNSVSPNRFFFNSQQGPASSASPSASVAYSAPRAMSPSASPASTARNRRGYNEDDPTDQQSLQRRNEQREKQISYGYNTPGYINMKRLAEHDPRLCAGGVIPLPPPSVSLKSSKRAWDVLIRKWRRALHMFDYVFIDGSEDEKNTTKEEMLEQQRLKWVSPIHHIIAGEENSSSPTSPTQAMARSTATAAGENGPSTTSRITTGPRVVLSMEEMLSRRTASSVPKKIPVEESLRRFLRDPSCYEPLTTVIPEHLLYQTRHNKFTVGDVGFKIVIAPSTILGPYASARSPSPEVPDFAPTQLVHNQLNAARVITSPSPSKQRPTTAFAEMLAMGVGSPSPSARASEGPIGSTTKRAISPHAAPFVPSASPYRAVAEHQLGASTSKSNTKPTPYRCQLARSSASPATSSGKGLTSNSDDEPTVRVSISSTAASSTAPHTTTTSTSMARSSMSLGHTDPTTGTNVEDVEEEAVAETKGPRHLLGEYGSSTDLTTTDLQGRY